MGKSLSRDQSHAIMAALATNVNWDDLDGELLQERVVTNAREAGRQFTLFLKNGARVHVVGRHTIDCSASPFIPKDWKVEEHRQTGDFVWDPNRVMLYFSDDQKSGKVIQGHELRKELESKPVLNANVLDYLLAHPELIPEEWKGKYVFFWGTIYRDPDGDLYVRCLDWGSERWAWGSFWLGNDWSGVSPAAVSAGV